MDELGRRERIHKKLSGHKTTNHKAYLQQIGLLAEQIHAWQQSHPQPMSIRWNFPTGVEIIGTIRDGLNSGLIIADEPAKAMLLDLDKDTADSPTVLMLRIALEGLEEA